MRYSLFLFLACISCGLHEAPDKINAPVFGYYSLHDSLIIGYSGIMLHSDSTYAYGAGMCVGSCIDSGKFCMHGDTLLFTSVMQNKVDTSNHGFGQVDPISGEKYLVRENRIYFFLDKGVYDTTAYWVREK